MSNAESPPEVFDVSKIAGNASTEIKQFLGPVVPLVPPKSDVIFGQYISQRLRVTEISLLENADQKGALEAKVVVLVDIEGDMTNELGAIHGACSAYLVDICGGIALNALCMAKTGNVNVSASQSINMVYYSPAFVGDTLRVVSTTMTLGKRTHSSKTEIWSTNGRKIVASGTHVKTVVPSMIVKPNTQQEPRARL